MGVLGGCVLGEEKGKLGGKLMYLGNLNWGGRIGGIGWGWLLECLCEERRWEGGKRVILLVKCGEG